jgi:hypothetical protein
LKGEEKENNMDRKIPVQASGLLLKYFVLKPQGVDIYAKASRMAMFAYSKCIMGFNPILAKEIWEWASTELANTEEGSEVGKILNNQISTR